MRYNKKAQLEIRDERVLCGAKRVGKIVYLTPKQRTCPVCGSNHIVDISRITGYLAFNERFGEGKTKERKARIDHNKNHIRNYV